jgi:cysteine-rich repeat protein
VKQAVGAEGGTVRLDDSTGARLLDLDIPSGALGATVTISAAPSTDSSPPSSTSTGAAATLVGSVFDLGPEGTVFAEPVRVSFHYDASALGELDPTELRAATIVGDAWEPLDSPELDAATGTVSGTTLHFSRFGVVAIGCANSEACNDGNPCTTDTCNAAGRCVAAPAGGACNDGNACTEGDSCQNGTCESGSAVSACAAVCGNGNVDDGEACDDGNATSSDGCTACAIDAGWSCAGSPSVCTPPVASGDDVDGDGSPSSSDCIDSWSAYCAAYGGLMACSARNQACNDLQTCGAISSPTTCAATPGCYFLQICHNYACATGAGNCTVVYPSCPTDGPAPASPRVGYRPEDIHPNATNVCQDGLDNVCSGNGDTSCQLN